MGEKAWKTGGWLTSAQLYAWFLKGIDFWVDKGWTCDGPYFLYVHLMWSSWLYWISRDKCKINLQFPTYAIGEIV